MTNYAVMIVGGVAVAAAIGIVLYTISQKSKTDKQRDRSKVLVDCFGAPMRTGRFTFSEAKDWILSHRGHLENGSQAVIMKANDNTLKTLGKDLDIGSGVENMLIIAVVNSEKNSIVASTLVQYETLDDNLENALAKGNGVLVVKG